MNTETFDKVITALIELAVLGVLSLLIVILILYIVVLFGVI